MLHKEDVDKDAQTFSAVRQDEPLPATLTFVLLLGVTFVVLWFGMFALLKSRW